MEPVTRIVGLAVLALLALFVLVPILHVVTFPPLGDYLHVTEKKLTQLQSPFDLLRLPKADDVPPPTPTPTPPQS